MSQATKEVSLSNKITRNDTSLIIEKNNEMASIERKPNWSCQRPLGVSYDEYKIMEQSSGYLPPYYLKPTKLRKITTLGDVKNLPHLTNCGGILKWLNIDDTCIEYKPTFEDAKRALIGDPTVGSILVPARHPDMFRDFQDEIETIKGTNVYLNCMPFSGPLSPLVLVGKQPKPSQTGQTYIDSVISFKATRTLLASAPELECERFDTICSSTVDALIKFIHSSSYPKESIHLCITSQQAFEYFKGKGEELFLWQELRKSCPIVWGLFTHPEKEI